MPPKRSKEPRTEPAGDGGPDSSAIIVDLRQGEKDSQNVKYHVHLLQAWEKVQEYFPDLVKKAPNSLDNGGRIRPYSAADWRNAWDGDGDRNYTCGINLAWLNMTYSATPGVPVRMGCIIEMVDKVFKTPRDAGVIHVAIPDADFNVLGHKGALQRVSPEELTSAFIMAMARDITNNEDATTMQEWLSHMLSTTCKFVMLPQNMDRYWHALAFREDIQHTYDVCRRTCFQRVHEVMRLMEKMREKMPDSQVTPQRVEKEYTDRLNNMKKDASGAISSAFVDTAMTVSKRMLSVPAIAQLLRDADSWSSGTFNPFDSHTKLQAMVNKCKTKETLIWCCQALSYRVRKGVLLSLSVTDISGGRPSRSDQRKPGLFDVLIIKEGLKHALISQGKELFQDEPDTVEWIDKTASAAMEDWETWEAHSDDGNLAWRAGRKPSAIHWLDFTSQAVFGTSYDSAIKLAVRAGRKPHDIVNTDALFMAATDVVKDKLAKERPAKNDETGQPAAEGGDSAMDVDGQEHDIVFLIPDGDKERKIISLRSLPDEKQVTVERITSEARTNITAQIQLLPQVRGEQPFDAAAFMAAFLTTPVGNTRGDTAKPTYIAIYYDPKLSGEPSHRPNIRTATVRDSTYKDLIKCIMDARGAKEGTIADGDVYFLLDGGKVPGMSGLMSPFQHRKKCVKQFTVIKDFESQSLRAGKVQGLATLKLDEGLHIVSADSLKIPVIKWKSYTGTTAGSLLGPVIMPPLSEAWTLKWPQKKELYGLQNLIGVGGKLKGGDDDLDEPCLPKAAPRTKESEEPAFYHCYPKSFYEELLRAIPVRAIVDLTPGEGNLALAAYEASIMYLGFPFNEKHADLLKAHLETVVLQAMIKEDHALYSAELHAAVTEDTAGKNSGKDTGNGDGKAKDSKAAGDGRGRGGGRGRGRGRGRGGRRARKGARSRRGRGKSGEGGDKDDDDDDEGEATDDEEKAEENGESGSGEDDLSIDKE